MDKLLWPIENLKNWPDNPREITKQKYQDLKESLQKEGQLMPLLVDTRPEHYGETIGGNMTLRALKDLRLKEVWVEPRLPNSDAHAFELAVKHNMRYGSWTDDLVAELAEKYKLEIDLPKLDLDLGKPIDLQTLLDRYGPEVEEDEVPEVPEEAISKLGEVYQLGRHKLMCGDATKIEDVEKLMDGKKADMVFTDPPYNLAYTYDADPDYRKNWDKFKNDKMTESEWNDFVIMFLNKAFTFTKNPAPAYIWIDWRQFNFIRERMQDNFPVKECIVWCKLESATPPFLGGDYKSAHEFCLYGKNGPKTMFNGKHTEANVWELPKDQLNTYKHPTQKPVGLGAKAINNSSKQDDIILDLFGGSGSTLIAAEQTNRTCYMMEIDPKYCDVIRTRYNNFVNNRKEAGNGKP
jgi:DNA modification methylase